MSKPYIHAQSSAKQYGGKPDDYIEIHTFMDSSKGAIADNRHRALTHNSWFIMTVLERVKFANSNEAPDGTFPTITNSDGKVLSVRDIGENHIMEDFRQKFIPTAQDYLQEITFQDWMQNGNGHPPSYQKLDERTKDRVRAARQKSETATYDGANSFRQQHVD